MLKSVSDPVRRAARVSMLCLPALLLAACGGGGGGGGGDSGGGGGGGSSAAGVVITTANAKAVAADAVEVAADGQYAEGGASMVLGAQVDAGSYGGLERVAGIGRKFLQMTPTGPALAAGVDVNSEVPCDSGKIVMSGTMPDSGTMTAGTRMTYSAQSCKFGDVTMNGTMSIEVLSGNLSNASFPFSMSVAYRITNFTISDGTGTETLNGDMRLDLTAHSATSETLGISGGSLTTSSGSHTGVLLNYSVTMSVSGGVTTQSVEGTVETTNAKVASGTVSYTISTVTAVTYTDSGSVTGGVIKVTGAGSSMLVTVTGTDAFKLDIDGNGDGIYETTLTTTRTELSSLL